jgi:hypothetical protein
VGYLGHLISAEGVAVDPAKIQAIQNWPIPATPKDVRGFLGLAGYYRKFVRGFGVIAAPLNQLLSKEGFRWSEEALMAFNKLKQALTSPPVLRLPNFAQQFAVECDACGDGLGATLSQDNKPIAYYSEALKGKARLLSTYDKEMLAVVKAVRKWRPYLLGRTFVIKTDHQSLKYLLEQRLTTPSQARWLPKIMGFDYSIQYRKGKENQGADALSRVAAAQLHAISALITDWWETLQQEVQQQPYYSTVATSPTLKLVQRDGVGCRKGGYT